MNKIFSYSFNEWLKFKFLRPGQTRISDFRNQKIYVDEDLKKFIKECNFDQLHDIIKDAALNFLKE